MNHLESHSQPSSGSELDALIITSEPGEFYAVGMKGEGLVLVTREESCYFTDSRYIELAEQSIEHAVVTGHVGPPPTDAGLRGTGGPEPETGGD